MLSLPALLLPFAVLLVFEMLEFVCCANACCISKSFSMKVDSFFRIFSSSGASAFDYSCNSASSLPASSEAGVPTLFLTNSFNEIEINDSYTKKKL